MNDNGMFWNSSENNSEEAASAVSETLRASAPWLSIYEARKSYLAVGFGLTAYSVISLAVALLIQVIALVVSPDVIEDILFLNIITPISLYLFALPVLLLILFAFGIKGEALPKKKMKFGEWMLIFVVGFGLMYIGSYVGQFVMGGLSALVGYDYSNMLESMVDIDKMWITVIFMCVIAPIGEEFVFRKLIIDRTHKYGGFVCIFFSALAFGLMHANFYQFFYAFALGLVLGYVYYKTGIIWYSVALHAAINFVGSVLTSYLADGIEKMTKVFESLNVQNTEDVLAFLGDYGLILLAEYAFVAFVFASMICAVVLPIVLRRRIKLGRKDHVLPYKRVLSASFFNAGSIIMLVVYATQFILTLISPLIGQ